MGTSTVPPQVVLSKSSDDGALHVTAPVTILRQPEVIRRVGVHATTIFRWEQKGLFPRRVQLGPNSVGWREPEIAAWLANRPAVGGAR